MKLALLVLASLAVVGGTASAALFVAPSEPAPPTAKAAAVMPPPKAAEPARHPAPVLEAKRAPVPILYVPKPAYVPPSAQDHAAAAAPATEGMTEAAARAAIAADGYKVVRGLSKSNGKWTAKALRGDTEVVLTVATDGSVASD